MQNMQEYKCPCCGGAIAFDGKICGCAQTGSGYPIQAGQESRQRRTDETYFRKTSFTEGFQRSESY